MSKLLVLALLLLSLINHGTDLATAWDDKDFFRYCPPSQCSQHGPEIRFPFQLESSNASSSSCGIKLAIACSGKDTILDHPDLGPYNISTIDYRRGAMKVIPFVDPCLLVQQKLISRSMEVNFAEAHMTFEKIFLSSSATLVCCSTEFTPDAADYIVGPVSCLSNRTHFLYYVSVYQDMYLLPLDCKVVPNGNVLIPMYNDPTVDVYRQQIFKESVERMLSFSETSVYWHHYPCEDCELCAFSSQRNQPFCMDTGIISNCPSALKF